MKRVRHHLAAAARHGRHHAARAGKALRPVLTALERRIRPLRTRAKPAIQKTVRLSVRLLRRITPAWVRPHHAFFLAFVLAVVLPFILVPSLRHDLTKRQGFRRNIMGGTYAANLPKQTFEAAFAARGDSVSMDVTRGSSTVSFATALKRARAANGRNGLSFRSSADTTIRYQTIPEGIKEDIILSKRPKTDSIQTSVTTVNAEPRVTPDGQIVFVNRIGEYQFHIRQPYAVDAAGNKTYAVRYRLNNYENVYKTISKNLDGTLSVRQQLFGPVKPSPSDGTVYTLTLELDAGWFHDPARVYPVTIDPTVVHDTTSEFSAGQFNRIMDTGSGSSPVLETTYREMPADIHTVGLWHMNEASWNGTASEVIDSSTKASHGTRSGDATTSSTARINRSGSFDGTGDYVNIGDNVAQDLTVPFTISAWIYMTQLPSGKGSDGEIVSKYSSSGTAQYTFAIGTDNTLYFWKHNGSSGEYAFPTGHLFTAADVNVWRHVAVTIDPTGLAKLYVNGQVVDRNQLKSTIIRTDISTNFLIGARNSPGNYFKGYIDDVRLSDIARTEEEIATEARRHPSAVYTSDEIDLESTNSILQAWNGLSWSEAGVLTGSGETAVNSTGLVAQWNFNETSGITANNDAEGTSCGGTPASCDGTLTNFDSTASQDANITSTWTANYRRWGAGALMFDGSDSYVSVTDNDSLDLTTAGSVELWFYRRKIQNYQMLVTKGDGANPGGYQMMDRSTDGRVVFRWSQDSDSVVSRTYVPNNTWTHVVGTYDGSTVKIYINGKLDNSEARSINATANLLPLRIGSRSDGYYYNGVIDGVKIWNRTLSATEVLTEYNSSNIEIQTRVGNSSNAEDGTWEAWRPTTNETQLDAFDTDGDPETILSSNIMLADLSTNQVWTKGDNSVPSNSDTTSNGGRVPMGTAGRGDQDGILSPAVIKDGSTYKMWYQGGNTNWRGYYATSSDGITWTKYDNTVPSASDTSSTNGRIPLGTAGRGDDTHIQYAAVIKDGSTYKMWYGGSNGANWRIYYATSSDGLTWTKYDNTAPAVSDASSTNGRIPLGNAGRGDASGVLPTAVIKDGSTYKMWYTGSDGTSWRTYYATSSDGLTWTKYDNTIPSASDKTSTNGRIPLGSAGYADDAHAYFPTVIKDGKIYKMWYDCHDGAAVRLCYATSLDGLTWAKYNSTTMGASNISGTDGRLGIGTTGAGDDVHVGYSPSVIKDGNTYKMWYAAHDGANWRGYYAAMTPAPMTESTDTTVKTEGTGSQKLKAGELQVDARTIALYHLDETSGASAYIKDATPNGNHGTPTGTSVATGIIDKGRYFAGSNSHYVNIPTVYGLSTSNVTIEAWVNLPSTSENGGFVKIGTTGGYGIGVGGTTFDGAGNNLIVIYEGLRWINTGKPIGTGWHHVALSIDASGYPSIYLDGARVYTDSTGAPSAPNTQTRIGGYNNGTDRYVEATIDDVRISNGARGDEEIAASYGLGRDQRINKTISSTDLSAKNTLPFSVAADRPGTYLSATIGETAFANYEPDATTVSLHHLDEDNNAVTDAFPGSSLSAAWVETDPNANKISVSNGLVLSAGTVAAWDSAIVSSNIYNRAAGQTIYAKFTTGSSVAAPNHMMIGWATNTTGTASYTNLNHALYFNAGGFYVYQDGVLTGGPYGSGYAINTTYEVKITLGTTGQTATYSVKGGAYTTWTVLLAADNAKTNSPMRAQVAQYQHTGTFNEVSVYQYVTVRDASPYGNTGTSMGAFAVDGVLGKGRKFSGGNDTVNINSIGVNTTAAGTNTVDFWMNWDGTGTVMPFGWNTSYDLYLLSASCMGFNTGNGENLGTTIGIPTNTWIHVAAVFYNGVPSASNVKLYINGVEQSLSFCAGAASVSRTVTTQAFISGWGASVGYRFSGVIDEVRISSGTRTAEEIRQAYESGLRSHPVTIDFAAKLDSGNLIASCASTSSCSDTGFTVDATVYGLTSKGSNLYLGDKIIVRENYNGTEYTAQGTVTGVTASTGAVTVASWDTGSTFPDQGSSVYGYTANASVMKWQREYWNITEPLDSHVNASAYFTLRTMDNTEGRTVWLDDLKNAGDYLTTPGGSTITSSTDNRYFQYRIIEHTADENVSAQLTSLTTDYTINTFPGTPTLDSPADTATTVGVYPALKTTATDTDADYLRYKIELCTNAGMTENCQTLDQTSSQAGWTSQNSQSGSAYASGSQATYVLQTALTHGQTYHWRSYAKDVGGSSTWSSTQGSPRSFTVTAGTTFQVKTGYYVGSGTDNLAITGLGFQPDMVMIKDDTGNGVDGILWKSSVMSGETTALLSDTQQDYATDAIQSLDADGFTVGTNADVNTTNIRFTWVAFDGSDCTSTGTFCVGSYTGNGGASQTISTVGFQPDYVGIKRSNISSSTGMFRTSAMPENYSEHFGNTAALADGTGINTFTSTGFTVGTSSRVNGSGSTYWYFALKSATSAFAVGSFTGDGTDNRSISMPFGPDYVMVKNSDTVTPKDAYYNLLESNGDYTTAASDDPNLTGVIKSLDVSGFTVGTAVQGNESSKTVYWAGVNGVPANTASGTFKMKVGTYSGNGTSQSVSGLGFQPDLVYIKDNAGANYAVFRTRLMKGDFTVYASSAQSSFTGGITSLDSNGFSVGADVTVNTNGSTYTYQAFGNAWDPEQGSGAADFVIGSYMANGIDSRNIGRLPFQPDILAIRRSGSFQTVLKTSEMSGDLAGTFHNTAEAADVVQALNSDGFQTGADTKVNAAGQHIFFYAFKVGPLIKTGSYTGTGSTQNITSPGIYPDLVWVKSAAATTGVFRPSTLGGDATLYFDNVAVATDRITALLSNGFSVGGSQSQTNTLGTTYRYVVFHEDGPPTTPTLVSPANDATGIAIRPNLVVSSTDEESDYIRYKIELCGNIDMTVGCQTFDQTSSQTGWSGQNTQSGTAYTSGSQATYTLQSDLSSGAKYYWRAYAIDPGGTNTWSGTQSPPNNFTVVIGTGKTEFNGLKIEGINVN